MKRNLTYIFGLSLALTFLSFVRAAEPITLESLLTEMTDRSALTQFPEQEYTSKEASSTDRRADSPEGYWFANDDFSYFIRTEERNGNKEFVMMDADGPGAIVRWWATATAYINNIYIYIDGAEEPTYTVKADELVGGAFFAQPPLSQEVARGKNFYLPIPYAKHIKVTCDRVGKGEGEVTHFYYQINYRTYCEGTEVESFSTDVLKRAQPVIDQTNALLSKPFDSALVSSGSFVRDHLFNTEVYPQREQMVMRLVGSGEITEITMKVRAEDLAQALRSTLVQIYFDGKMTVCAPIGDFFGSGVGVNSSSTWFTQTTDDGVFACHWIMSYKTNTFLSFFNAGNATVKIEGTLRCQAAPWKGNSLYFHSQWHQEREIATVGGKGTKDWNYVTIEGKGLYLGDVLSVVNRSPQWWGEGDEKIYIDGETFPSHFGTGSEDYYGYAWGTPDKFTTAWTAQPRVEGPQTFGNITNLRFRSLDVIPFKKSLKFDMEVWHWAETKVDYAVTTFWYGDTNLPTASFDSSAVYKEAGMPVHYETK